VVTGGGLVGRAGDPQGRKSSRS